jgi:hypothetical protein
MHHPSSSSRASYNEHVLTAPAQESTSSAMLLLWSRCSVAYSPHHLTHHCSSRCSPSSTPHASPSLSVCLLCICTAAPYSAASGRLRCLRELELCCASQACLEHQLPLCVLVALVHCSHNLLPGLLHSIPHRITPHQRPSSSLTPHPVHICTHYCTLPLTSSSGRLRCLRELELCCASQACLDGGLLALSFLPRLTSLSVSLDIHPASPACLSELPTGLASLKLGSMWLEGLPQQLSELTGEPLGLMVGVWWLPAA